MKIPALPTERGQAIRIIGYGGGIPRWACGAVGVVVRFNRNGHPVVEVPTLGHRTEDYAELTDRDGAAVLVDLDNKIVWVEKLDRERA